ncbi:hypothetical protein [Baaleninema simplex]|uniref:hypothetical protein n=1 Tax=Baaleninema simplex TaxID=2862350 RepID=UPI00034AE8E6|nr:hypothetical protein [Baaleninema simplex]
MGYSRSITSSPAPEGCHVTENSPVDRNLNLGHVRNEDIPAIDGSVVLPCSRPSPR